uniref:F-ATPase gamma subunit n=1 Tax=Andalucia godoyi TaxID=505711 RepID=M4QCP1_ANDGO|nr:ATP synthase F1 subunit gamma [Andalucia godoyi]AGH23965.1 ATP synthase F1 subunit gamma [Andalucia godoyi]
MASTKEFKNRLKSITSIKKITKAMKMVAASKLRQAQRSCEGVRPFQSSLQQLLPGSVSNFTGSKHLIIAITTDRGLCGGVNSSVVKTTKKVLKELVANGSEVSIVCVGEKGRDALVRECGKSMVKIINDVTRKPVNFLAASALSEEILSYPFDRCTIVYNEFKSVIAQVVTTGNIPSYDAYVADPAGWGEYEFDSDQASLLYNFFEFSMATRILSALLENATSEQGARMSAMDSAARNAGDMINKLSLSYNKARQAAITSELIDIISAAGAVSK